MTRYIPKKFLCLSALFSLFLLSGCWQKEEPKKITFQATYKKEALSCQTPFFHEANSTIEPLNIKKWQYQQLQFFIHNIEVKTKKAGWKPWLMTTNPYQVDNIALLGEVCGEKNKQSHWQLALTPLTEAVNITELRFTVGVPFSQNHLNPLTQASPLNVSSMFWGWQGGHKFMRIELMSKNDDWLFHLGSTGCKALSPVRAPKEECLQPNRVLITLPFTQHTTDIEFDLAVLFQHLTLTRANNCQSAVDKESCKVLFENLAMNTGTNQSQLLFKAKNNDQ
jgi:uncharacterized repeat protein (TIGR04052 family)